MPGEQSWVHKLAELDVTMPLATAGLGVCGIGYFFGAGAALWAVLYGLMSLLAIGMPLLLFFAWYAQTEQLKGIRQQHGGRLGRDWRYLWAPSVSFLHDGTHVTVRIRRHGKYRPGMMEVDLEWPGPAVQLNVQSLGVVTLLGRLAGFQEIQVGRESFDDVYVVRGSEPARVSRLLTRNVQQRIAELPEQKYLVISLDQGHLRVRAQHYSLTSNVQDFTEAVLRLYDALRQEAP